MSTFSSLAGKLPTSTSNPTSPIPGDEYYNTGNNTWMRWNGVDWTGVAMTTSTSTSSTSSSTSTTST